MTAQPFWSFQRTAGALMVAAILPLALGVILFLNRNGIGGGAPPSQALFVWERSFIMAAVVLTAIGLMLLDGYLQNSDGRTLVRVGAITYLIAGTLLVAAEAFGLSQGEKNVYALIVIYVVLSFLAQAAIGGALLQSKLLPAWIGWMTIVWNLAWLVVLPITTPSDMYFPVLHHLMPLLIGTPLLLR